MKLDQLFNEYKDEIYFDTGEIRVKSDDPKTGKRSYMEWKTSASLPMLYVISAKNI